jgi:transcriptional regulator with XRE-family HTH domain
MRQRLAFRLRRLREDRGLTQEELAKRSGISRVYVAFLEAGRQDPRVSIVMRLARALKVKAGALLD